MKKDFMDHVLTGVLLFCLAVFGLMALAVPFIQYADWQAANRFMEACTKDHKDYECVAMWRAGARRGGGIVVERVTP